MSKVSASINKSRDKFIAQFEKDFGGGKIDRSGDKESNYDFISTGSLGIDQAMGGGYVCGRITEIWGGDAIGKTTLVLQGIREAQKKFPEKLIAFIDMEGTFDRAWAVIHGVNVGKDSLYVILPESAEEVADQMKSCLQSGLFSMVVLDSIGAMIPEVEKEKDADEAVVATQAKIITRMVKIAAVEARVTKTAVVLLNQVRANISAYGKATQTSGGFALKHCSTHKLEIKLGGERLRVRIDGEERTVGHEIAVMVERNKIAQPFRRASITLLHSPSDRYGQAGIDPVRDAMNVAIRSKAIKQRGAWYDTPDGESHNGKEALESYLRANIGIIDQIRDSVLGGVVINTDADLDSDITKAAQEDGIEGEKFSGLKSRFGSLSGGLTGDVS